MIDQKVQTDRVEVNCSVCLKQIPKSEARVSEASDYVLYFCGLECFEKWRATEPVPPAQSPAEKSDD